MTSKNHISIIRSNKSIASLSARIQEMNKILTSNSFPKNFDIHKSDQKIVDWEDASIGISKISLRIARDNYPAQWAEIQLLKNSLKILAKKISTKNTKKNNTKIHALKTSKEDKNALIKLTDELIMLRTAYLNLVDILEQNQHKSRIVSDAIRRHHAHHGLQSILSEKHQNESTHL